jgi:AraC-like DNA-binding protein/ligand-binding sensor protein
VNNDNKWLIDKLSQSGIYLEYQKAFVQVTGLPLTLRQVDCWRLAQQNKKIQNPFCLLMAQNRKTCAACLGVQKNISATLETPQIATCYAGLVEVSVPLLNGKNLLGFLQTGQVMLKKPREDVFEKFLAWLSGQGVQFNISELRDLWFSSMVISPKKLEAIIQMLVIFSKHLGMITNQLIVQRENAEPAVITRAKQYIIENQSNVIRLTDVAKHVNTSTFYFCKLFRKVTGLNFTDYVSRVRIEKAKNLLLNPNLRVSEIAYEVGFQSLTHFNRTFRRLVGESPSEYRMHILRV